MLPETAPVLNPNQALLIALSLLATASTTPSCTRRFWKALRATIQERDAARLAGIPVERMGSLPLRWAGPSSASLASVRQAAYLQPFAGPSPR